MQNQISWLSFDLGSNLGWNKSVCTFRPELKINVVDHGTIDLNHLASEWSKRNYSEVLTPRRIRINIFMEQIKKLVDNSNADAFVTEDVFCNPHRVDAFRALVIYMDRLESYINNEKNKRLYTIPATQIKKHISNYGHADKSLVIKSVLDNNQITMKRPQDATTHEFDSVAVVWGFIREYLMVQV
jgi:Holliday junction resolvasome RuvABC endonuclease subunit